MDTQLSTFVNSRETKLIRNLPIKITVNQTHLKRKLMLLVILAIFICFSLIGLFESRKIRNSSTNNILNRMTNVQYAYLLFVGYLNHALGASTVRMMVNTFAPPIVSVISNIIRNPMNATKKCEVFMNALYGMGTSALYAKVITNNTSLDLYNIMNKLASIDLNRSQQTMLETGMDFIGIRSPRSIAANQIRSSMGPVMGFLGYMLFHGVIQFGITTKDLIVVTRRVNNNNTRPNEKFFYGINAGRYKAPNKKPKHIRFE